jgi:hypothetical protein
LQKAVNEKTAQNQEWLNRNTHTTRESEEKQKKGLGCWFYGILVYVIWIFFICLLVLLDK